MGNNLLEVFITLLLLLHYYYYCSYDYNYYNYHLFLLFFSTFVLAWGVLPIQMQYHLSGEFTVAGKVMICIKLLLSYFLIFIVS